jgi:hypothetical protein
MICILIIESTLPIVCLQTQLIRIQIVPIQPAILSTSTGNLKSETITEYIVTVLD